MLVVRRRAPDAAAFKAPGYPWTVGLFVLLVAGVVALVAINRPLQGLTGFGIVALGWPAYGVYRRLGILGIENSGFARRHEFLILNS